jgi:hypothetical protein
MQSSQQTVEEPQQTACPWCGGGGANIEACRGLKLVRCNACDQLLPAETRPADDGDVLEDTAEYDIVPCGPETFRVERRRSPTSR